MLRPVRLSDKLIVLFEQATVPESWVHQSDTPDSEIVTEILSALTMT